VSYGLIQETYTKALTTAESTVFNQSVNNVEFVMIEVDVSGSPLTSFTVQMKGHAAGGMLDMFSSSDDYINPKGLLRGASCDMTTFSTTGGWVMIEVRGISEIAVKCSSSVTSNITCRVGG